MADKLGLDGQVKDLKLGQTFNKSYKDGAFHTIRYDFKPASVDKQKMGTVEIEGNHQVSVTVPRVEGSGTNQTVFKGNHKPVAKECILIIDHSTGEIVLERISQAISVKTTRPEGSSRVPNQRPTTPLDPSLRKNSPPQKCSPSHPPPSRGSANSLSRPSPSHGKFSPSSKASPHPRSPAPSKSPSNIAMPGSMPMLGYEEGGYAPEKEVSDSSSDSDSNSSSSSGSDSDSDSDPEPDTSKKANGHGGPPAANMPNGSDLNDDLELSSVSEDSD